MQNTLLLTLLLPTLAVPFVYLLGKKSSRTTAAGAYNYGIIACCMREASEWASDFKLSLFY